MQGWHQGIGTGPSTTKVHSGSGAWQTLLAPNANSQDPALGARQSVPSLSSSSWIAVLAIVTAVICANGCTADALRRRAVNHTAAWVDVHYREVMDNLAMVAADPDVLPSYSTFDYGTTNVTDKLSFNGSVAAPMIGLVTGSTDPGLQRNASLNWTLSQVTAPEKLRALRLAFRYAVYNDHNFLSMHDHDVTLDSFCYATGCADNHVDHGTLQNANAVGPDPGKAKCDPPPYQPLAGTPGFYFDVKAALENIPPGWLHRGTKHEAPRCARFTASCGCATVWVLDNDMGALSQFALVIQRIARDTVEAQYYPKALPLTYVKQVPVFWNCTSDNQAIWVTANVSLPVDCYGHVIPVRSRLDGVAPTDNKLKSAVIAASASGT